MQRFEIRLVSEDEIKVLIAVANNMSEILKLLKNKYTLNHYKAITIKPEI